MNFLTQKKTFIIAEIGKSFIQTKEDQPISQYLHNAKELVLAAQQSGADAVKFQTHQYQDEQLDIAVTSAHFQNSDRYSWVKRNTEATPYEEFWVPLKKYCDDLGIEFFSTPMSRQAAQLLERLGVNLWKIGSGDILDLVLLEYIATTKKPIIMSSGMSTLKEVDLALNYLDEKGAKYALLHCVSRYPCPPEEVSLGTIDFFKLRYDVPIGFSDHSLSLESTQVAVALGATIIEKHFSLSRTLWGSDHKVSLQPEEFKQMVDKIRKVEAGEIKIDPATIQRYYGSKKKTLQTDEAQFRDYFRKTLVAARNIQKGEKIESEMVYAMRPQKFATGLPSERLPQILNSQALVDIHRYQPFDKKSVRL